MIRPLSSRTFRVGQVNALFDTFDEDGSGSVDYKEISKALSRSANTDKGKKLKAGVLPSELPAPLHETQDYGAAAAAQLFDSVVLTAPDGTPMPQTLYPRHCVQFTWGAKAPKEMETRADDVVLQEGTAAYLGSRSAFYDYGKHKQTGAIGTPRSRDVTKVTYVTDHLDVRCATAARRRDLWVARPTPATRLTRWRPALAAVT